MARQISMTDEGAKLFYRKCLYGLAMDIGDKKEIFDRFNQSMLNKSLSAANRNTIENILKGKDVNNREQRQISMLSVFNELERITEFSISSNRYEGLVRILKNAKSSECTKLADNFMQEIKPEGDFPYEAEKGKSKTICVFLRNESLGKHWEGWEGLLSYTEGSEYIESLRKRGIEVHEFNSFLHNDLWVGLKEKLSSKEPANFDYILVIMIGFSSSVPIPGMFMMNTKYQVGKDLNCFDILGGLYENLVKQFRMKKILVVSLTLPVNGYDHKFTTFQERQYIDFATNIPRNFGYLHLHARDNKSMAELFKESFTDSWVNTTDILRKFKQNSEVFPQIATISFASRLNMLDQYQNDSVDSSQLEIGKMLIYKIRVDGSNLNTCKQLSKVLDERSDSYHLLSMAFGYKNEKIDQDSLNKLEKKLSIEASSDTTYDFYTFLICCSEEVPSHFYKETVQACYIALHKAGQLLKPKLIIIDAELKKNDGFVAPEIQPETILLCCYSKPEKEQDSMISLLACNLEADPYGNYDLRTQLLDTLHKTKVKHSSSYDCNISRPVFLVTNPT